MRAQKNDIEQKGMRRAHVRDAVVMCEFFGYFEEKVIFSFAFNLMCTQLFQTFILVLRR